MPAKSKKQERFMKMCAHESGRRWAKHKGVKCPPKSVAKEFYKGKKGKKRRK